MISLANAPNYSPTWVRGRAERQDSEPASHRQIGQPEDAWTSVKFQNNNQIAMLTAWGRLQVRVIARIPL